jgi:hypothetical protein
VRLALEELDAVVDQVRVEVFDLVFGELDFFESGRDLVVVQKPLVDAILDELLELFDVWKSDIDGEHGPPRAGRRRRQLDTQRAGWTPPAHPLRAGMLHRLLTNR